MADESFETRRRELETARSKPDEAERDDEARIEEAHRTLRVRIEAARAAGLG